MSEAITRQFELAAKPEIDDPFDIVRSVNLTEDDYTRAGLRPRPRKKLPKPRPFDRSAVINRIIENRSGLYMSRELSLDPGMTREEASLWFTAIYEFRSGQYKPDNERLEAHLLGTEVPLQIDPDAFVEPLRISTPPALAMVMYCLLPQELFGRFMAAWLTNRSNEDFEYVRSNILTYATDEEIEAMRKGALTLDAPAAPLGASSIMFLQQLGETQTVRVWIENCAPESSPYPSNGRGTRAVLLACGDPGMAVTHMRRLRLVLGSVTDARAWLALAQHGGLDLIAESVKLQYSKASKESMITAAARVLAPETAPFLLDWQAQGLAISVCKQWFESNPKLTVAGLIPIAAGVDSARALRASTILNSLVKRGYAQLIQAHLEALSADQFQRVAPTILLVSTPDTNIEQLIHIEPWIEHHPSDFDWLPSNEPRKRIPIPPQRPFDRDAIVAKIVQSRRECEPALRFRWFGDFQRKPGEVFPDDLQPQPGMTLEEAQFWTSLYSLPSMGTPDDNVILEMGREPHFPLNRSNAWATVAATSWSNHKAVIAALFAQLTIDEMLDVLISTIQPGANIFSYTDSEFLSALTYTLLPYLDDQDVELIRERLRPVYQRAANKESDFELTRGFIDCASSLGLGSELRTFVADIPSRSKTTAELRDVAKLWRRVKSSVYEVSHTTGYNYEFRILRAIISLDEPATIAREIRRLKYPVWDIGMWLALTKLTELDYVSETIQSATSQEEAEFLVAAFSKVHAPEAVPHFLDLIVSSRASAAAKQWFFYNPVHAIRGLIPIAIENGERADLAATILRELMAAGHTGLLQAAASLEPDDVQKRLKEQTLEYVSPFDRYEQIDGDAATLVDSHLKDLKPLVSSDVSPKDFWPILVEVNGQGKRLSERQTRCILQALKKSSLDVPHGALAELKMIATPASLDHFARSVFNQWVTSGFPSQDRWKMTTLGLLGGDRSTNRLSELVRKWPGESQHARAVHGLDCLASIGSEAALIEIYRLSQRSEFRGLKGAAQASMDKIAAKRNLSRPQLEDLSVPSCGLDERGSRTFDFGPRQFVLSINSDMKPVLREIVDGKAVPKLLTDMPKPNLKDDPTKSEEAVAEWKALKKQVAETAKVQAVRLEQAMVTGRRWSAEEFDMLLVHHPLMTNIVRLLLWGTFDSEGALAQTFRITEDMTAADSSDEPIMIPSSARIGIVHPMQLTEVQKSAWWEIWSDYELVPPFPQLGRPIHKLSPEEADVTNLERFSTASLPAPTLVFGLEKLGWIRGRPADAGGFSEHVKPFYSSGITAIVDYEPGAYVSSVADSEDQTITGVFFVPRIYSATEHWPSHDDRIPWNQVDPVVVSEVLADLTAIVAKAK